MFADRDIENRVASLGICYGREFCPQDTNNGPGDGSPRRLVGDNSGDFSGCSRQRVLYGINDI
jgi:hypothetical protein